jgi:hypothetical protein
MPQPIDKILPKPHVALNDNALKDKPDYAILVCQIFAVWARIEQELSFLLVRVLGATAAPAIAMFSTLTAQHLQLGALEAAAKAALPPDDFDIFAAALSVANQVQAPRNHLAHWTWAECKQRPDLLCLADPEMLSARDFRVAKILHTAPSPTAVNRLELAELNLFNVSQVQAYSKADLERALRDLREAYGVLLALTNYLDPRELQHITSYFPDLDPSQEVIRAEALEVLNASRLFREALARIREGQKSKSQLPREPHPREPEKS